MDETEFSYVIAAPIGYRDENMEARVLAGELGRQDGVESVDEAGVLRTFISKNKVTDNDG
jgi:hypothetical protein